MSSRKNVRKALDFSSLEKGHLEKCSVGSHATEIMASGNELQINIFPSESPIKKSCSELVLHRLPQNRIFNIDKFAIYKISGKHIEDLIITNIFLYYVLSNLNFFLDKIFKRLMLCLRQYGILIF